MKKRIGCIAICLGLLAGLAGCTLLGQSRKSTEEERFLFGYTGMDLTDPSYRTALTQLRAIVEENGDALLTYDPGLDNEKQLQGIRDMLEQGIDLLFLGPVDIDGVFPALEDCRRAGVPVICLDSKVTATDYIATFVGGDNYQLGLLIGQEILRDHPDGGTMAMLTNPLARSVTERERGIRDALKESNVDISVCMEITRYEEVLPKAEQILDDDPDVNIFWGLNDDVTLLLHSSFLAAGRQDEIMLYGTGSLYREKGSDQLMEAVQKGYVQAASVQEPAQWGILCGDLAYRLLGGETLEAEYLGDSLIINQENVGEYAKDE